MRAFAEPNEMSRIREIIMISMYMIDVPKAFP
jgi:hypothetical protein